MAITFIELLSGAILIATLLILLILLRRMEKKNTVMHIDRSTLSWSDYKCPKCRQFMQHGYTLAGRGIIWASKDSKKPGPFSNVAQALENTASLRLSPPLNMAWYCQECKLILMDHSKMLKQ
jgi:hypothetical protein